MDVRNPGWLSAIIKSKDGDSQEEVKKHEDVLWSGKL